MNAIEIKDVWKEYRLGVIGHGTIVKDWQSWWAKIRGTEDPNGKVVQDHCTDVRRIEGDRFWALKGVGLEVPQGEVLGVIGMNGAGKSTLLKILSRVTAPSRGRIRIKGRVASLLEVGTGFHPELTGRENIFLNGAILGMHKREIKKKLDEIINFSGVEAFVDTPVKRYSSGMYVRLAFAVAAHLEPEIMIVDEVLAVGDADFQKKCLGKMGDVAKEGRTILFVSHNMHMISSLCPKSICLDGGQVRKMGSTSDVILDYLTSTRKNHASVDYSDQVERVGDKYVQLLRARLVNDGGGVASEFRMDECIHVVLEYEISFNEKVVAYFHLKTIAGVHVMSVEDEKKAPVGPGIFQVECTLPGNFLNDGAYSLGFSVCSFRKGIRPHFYVDDVLAFNIVENLFEKDALFTGKHEGIVRPILDWRVSSSA